SKFTILVGFYAARQMIGKLWLLYFLSDDSFFFISRRSANIVIFFSPGIIKTTKLDLHNILLYA
ncbi:hypothetical protein ACJX0J_020998, partial [Zea mays]